MFFIFATHHNNTALRINSLVYSVYLGHEIPWDAYSTADVDLSLISTWNSKSGNTGMGTTYNVLTLNLTPQEESIISTYFQDLAVRNALEKEKPYDYSIFGEQCATTVKNALAKVGINDLSAGYSWPFTPKNLYYSLQNNSRVIKNETFNATNYK